jgi:orotate phosphoribosyltransferase
MSDTTPFILRLHEIGAVKFGEFTLKSGRVAPVYVDLRVLISYPDALRQAGAILASRLRSLTFDRIAGIPYAGLPLGVAIIYLTHPANPGIMSYGQPSVPPNPSGSDQAFR